jgi:hypothetical protein
MKKIPYLLMGAALLMYTISPGQSSKSSAPQKLTITDGEPVATKPVATGTAPKKITSVEGITEYALKNGHHHRQHHLPGRFTPRRLWRDGNGPLA